MKNGIIKVFVDSREQKVGKQSRVFFTNQNITVEQKELKNGDLVFILKDSDPLYIERKSFPDFVSSYIKGHIQDQALRLSEYRHKALIIHGSFDDIRRVYALRRINQNAFYKMLVNIQMFYGLPTFIVNNVPEYFKFSLLLAESTYKHANDSLSLNKLGARVKDRPDISMLCAQDFIGEKKAQLLLDNFGSVKNVLYAERDDLLSIKGIGDNMVKNIKDLKDVFENGLEEK